MARTEAALNIKAGDFVSIPVFHGDANKIKVRSAIIAAELVGTKVHVKCDALHSSAFGIFDCVLSCAEGVVVYDGRADADTSRFQ